MASPGPSNTNNVLKRALALYGVRDVTLSKVNPEAFTDFMRILQPSRQNVPAVQILTFDPPGSFKASLLAAVIMRLKYKKAPGPDKVCTYLFQITPSLLLEAALKLWKVLGCMGHVPSLIRCGLLSRIYKKIGDQSLLTNNRPMSHLSLPGNY